MKSSESSTLHLPTTLSSVSTRLPPRLRYQAVAEPLVTSPTNNYKNARVLSLLTVVPLVAFPLQLSRLDISRKRRAAAFAPYSSGDGYVVSTMKCDEFRIGAGWWGAVEAEAVKVELANVVLHGVCVDVEAGADGTGQGK